MIRAERDPNRGEVDSNFWSLSTLMPPAAFSTAGGSPRR
jgi:hypothetical protein